MPSEALNLVRNILNVTECAVARSISSRMVRSPDRTREIGGASAAAALQTIVAKTAATPSEDTRRFEEQHVMTFTPPGRLMPAVIRQGGREGQNGARR
jgi:hypothetical protein